MYYLQKLHFKWNEERKCNEDDWHVLLKMENKQYGDLARKGFELARTDHNGHYRIADGKGREIQRISTGSEEARRQRRNAKIQANIRRRRQVFSNEDIILEASLGADSWTEVQRLPRKQWNEIQKECHLRARRTGKDHRLVDNQGTILATAIGK